MFVREDVTAGELAHRLEAAGLELLAGPAGAVVRSASCTVNEPLAALPKNAAGVLLGVGVADVNAAQLVRDARSCGFDAVVLHRTGVTAEVIDTADEVGLAVLGAEPAMAWLQVERVVSSVLTGSARSTDGGPGSDLFDFANSVASVVGGAVSIEDLSQRVLAYSTLDGQPIDDDRRDSILGRQVPDLPENDAQYAAVLGAGGPVHISGVGAALDRWAVAIRLGAETLGTLWVVDTGQSVPDDGPAMLQRAAELAAVLMLQARTAAAFESERRSALVRTILVGGAEARGAAERLGLDLTGPFVAMTFVGEAHPDEDGEGPGPEVVRLRWQRFLTMVRGYTAGWIPAVGLHAEAGAIDLLLHGDESRDSSRVVANAEVLIERALAWGLRVRAGIGSVVEAPERVRESRMEAEALTQIDDGRRGGRVLHAERDHGVLALWWLRQTVRDRPGIASPHVRRLLEHDARHGSDFVKTWVTWFDHAMDTASSAAALSVHPNTLRYRLRRATEISGLTGDPDDLLVAWLTARLLVLDGERRLLA